MVVSHIHTNWVGFHKYAGDILAKESAWTEALSWGSVTVSTSHVHAQSCPILGDPMDCSPPVSSIHGISQARILEWVAISFSRGSSQPRDRTFFSCISCIAGRFFTTEPWLCPRKNKQSRRAGVKDLNRRVVGDQPGSENGECEMASKWTLFDRQELASKSWASVCCIEPERETYS